MRFRGSVARALNMVLLSVTVPRDQNSVQKSEKELISIMEQMYGSLTNIHSKGWNKFIYGEPYIGLEIAVPNSSQEIRFFISVPRNYKDIFQKQLHGLYPSAEIESLNDYSIFHPQG